MSIAETTCLCLLVNVVKFEEIISYYKKGNSQFLFTNQLNWKERRNFKVLLSISLSLQSVSWALCIFFARQMYCHFGGFCSSSADFKSLLDLFAFFVPLLGGSLLPRKMEIWSRNHSNEDWPPKPLYERHPPTDSTRQEDPPRRWRRRNGAHSDYFDYDVSGPLIRGHNPELIGQQSHEDTALIVDPFLFGQSSFHFHWQIYPTSFLGIRIFNCW